MYPSGAIRRLSCPTPSIHRENRPSATKCSTSRSSIAPATPHLLYIVIKAKKRYLNGLLRTGCETGARGIIDTRIESSITLIMMI